jgi:ABC-type multidrug transport system ATPase subunit
VLTAEALFFTYPGHELFKDLSLRILPGITLVRGGDGCGKTTLLRLLAGQQVATAGQLQIKNIQLPGQTEAYQQQVFFTELGAQTFDEFTPRAYFEWQRGRYAGFDADALARLIDGLALQEQMDKKLYMLSTGSRRKVGLAAAFASGAALTLLDQPFAALDQPSIGFVRTLLQEGADHRERAWVIADYTAPADVYLAGVIELGD